MAKRRKQYRGTPEQHMKDAALHARLIKRHVEAVHSHLRADRCMSALRHLTTAESDYGTYVYARGESRKRTGGHTHSAQAGMLNKAARALAKKCFRTGDYE